MKPIRIDGYEVPVSGMLEELDNVVRNAPVYPGNVIGKRQAYACVQAGWITRTRGGGGWWIPTAAGIQVWHEEQGKSTGSRRGVAYLFFMVFLGALIGNLLLRWLGVGR